jgi:hypothetical protein
LKKVTVPVVPVALLLPEVMVAVKTTGIAVVTPVVGLAAKEVAVAVGDTVTLSSTAVVTGL